jgi:hypothetical protein
MVKSNQGKVPKGIQTSQTASIVEQEKKPAPKSEKDFINAIVSDNPKALPKIPEGSGRYLFDAPSQSEAPRNVYRETVHNTDGETVEYLWWHCENGNYIGRKEVTRINPRTEEKYLLGYDYNILATKDNIKKALELSNARTKFYKKFQTDTRSISKDEFL